MREREVEASENFILHFVMGSMARLGIAQVWDSLPHFCFLYHNAMSSGTPTTRPVVFMDVSIGETPAGRMKMELFSDIVPKSDLFHLHILSRCSFSQTGLLRTSDNYALENFGLFAI